MPNTPRMSWPFPSFAQDPWYDTMESLLTQQDAAAFAAREDRNLVLMGGGTLTWNATTGVLTWSAAIELFSPVTGFLESLAASQVTLEAGEVFYVTVTRNPTAPVTLTSAVASVVPSSNDTVLMGVRRGDLVYFRNGKVITDGESVELFMTSGGGGETPVLSAVLVEGAATGGTSIQVSTGDAVFGETTLTLDANEEIVSSVFHAFQDGLGVTKVAEAPEASEFQGVLYTPDGIDDHDDGGLYWHGPGVETPVRLDRALPPVDRVLIANGINLTSTDGVVALTQFEFDTSEWDPSYTYTLKCVAAMTGDGTEVLNVHLYNLTTDEQVDGNLEADSSHSTPTVRSVDLNVGPFGGQFKDEVAVYEVRGEVLADGAGTAILGQVWLALRQTVEASGPTISGLPLFESMEDWETLGPIAFTVGHSDEMYDLDTLNITATSDDQLIIADADIVLGGSGADRTLTLTAEDTGFALITVEVSDGVDTAIASMPVNVMPAV